MKKKPSSGEGDPEKEPLGEVTDETDLLDPESGDEAGDGTEESGDESGDDPGDDSELEGEPAKNLGVRILVGAAAATILVGGIGAYALGVFDDDSPSESPSPSVNISASPSPSPSGVVSYFDDGIAPEEYPIKAASRGSGYPEALRMEEWVWERVGPDWMLALFGPDWERPTSVAVVYLVSPEGVYFEVTSLASSIGGNPQLVSWHEDERTARINWGWSQAGGLLDLRNGSVDPIAFTMNQGESETEGFLAMNEGNREVWYAYGRHYLDFGVFTWTEQGGWSRLFGANRDVVLASGGASSLGGSTLLFEIAHPYDSGLASPRSGEAGRPNLVVYDLDSGRDSLIKPQWPTDTTWCYFSRWLDEISVVYLCWNESAEEYRSFRVFLDGDKAVQRWNTPSDFETITEGSVVTLEGIPLQFVSERANSMLYEIRMVTDEGPVVAASFDNYLSRAGHAYGGVVERAPGVFRFWSRDRIVLGIDTVTGTVIPYVPDKGSDGVPLLPRSYVFYGEGSIPVWDYCYEGGCTG